MEDDYFFTEKHSIRESARSLKKYGSTCNHVRNELLLIRHELEKTDTLQGIALKYGCTVSWYFILIIGSYACRKRLFTTNFFSFVLINDGRLNRYVEPIVCSLKTAFFWDSSWWYRLTKNHRIIPKMIDHNPYLLVHQTMNVCRICKQIHKTVNRWRCSVQKRRIARILTSLWAK